MNKVELRARRINFHEKLDTMRRNRDIQMRALWNEWQENIRKAKEEYRASIH